MNYLSMIRSILRYWSFTLFGHNKSIKRFLLLIVTFLFLTYLLFQSIIGKDDYVNEYHEINTNLLDKLKQDNIRSFEYQGYCIIPNVIERKMASEEERISLILHSTNDNIDNSIVKQIENWDGPISLAVVFNPDIHVNQLIYCTKLFLEKLKQDNRHVDEKLSVHFIIKSAIFIKSKECLPEYSTFNFVDDEICNKPKPSVVLAQIKLQKMINYPINFARNLARNLTSTKYILLADLDHFFSKNFEKKMLTLAKRVMSYNPKTVLVYRIFEVSNDVVKFPEDKRELFNLYKNKQAQIFHYSFNKEHAIDRLDQWFTTPEYFDDDTEIQFYPKYKSFAWEPQFVSLRDIPLHDTSFSYPIFDNTVLRWEMCRQGYSFAVVYDVFMYHPGIKVKTDVDFLNKARNLIYDKAIKSGKIFDEKMDQLYPNTQDDCPKFNWNNLYKWYGKRKTIDKLLSFIRA